MLQRRVGGDIRGKGVSPSQWGAPESGEAGRAGSLAALRTPWGQGPGKMLMQHVMQTTPGNAVSIDGTLAR